MGLWFLRWLGSSPLKSRSTLAIYKASGKTPLPMDFLNKCLGGSFNSLKQFLITLSLSHHNLGFSLFLRKKRLQLSSLTVIWSAGIVVSILFKKISNALDAAGIFLANSRPLFVKNLLNSFAKPILLATSFLLLTRMVGRRDPDLFVLPITSFVMFHAFSASLTHSCPQIELSPQITEDSRETILDAVTFSKFIFAKFSEGILIWCPCS